MGVTEPGTRRVAVVHETCVWATFHALPFIVGDENELPADQQEQVIEKIEAEVIDPYTNKLLIQKMQEVLT
jgi:hypothetical protein